MDRYEPEFHRCIERIRPKPIIGFQRQTLEQDHGTVFKSRQTKPCFFGIYLVICVCIQGSLNYLFWGIKQQDVKIVERIKDISISTWSHTQFGSRYKFTYVNRTYVHTSVHSVYTPTPILIQHHQSRDPQRSSGHSRRKRVT